MRFIWMDSPTHCRCTTDRPVQIETLEWGGQFIQEMGYILPRDGRYMACVYGTVYPDAPGKFFDAMHDAKRYVEEQATVGLALNRLTR